MTEILRVEHLNKTFHLHAIDRTVVSLRDVSFTVRRGDHLALAGSSGAGKSSLLRCLYRTYLPDSGTVRLTLADGPRELTTLSDRHMARLRGREFGYVSQFLQAPPRVGPLELVTQAARRRGLRHDPAVAVAKDSLTRLGIDEALWDMDCAVLSGGERQRVNLAAGTVSPPQLLLLDEPVSALDPANREKALALIETLRAQDVTVVAVYHDMQIIRRLANRVLVLADGRTIAEGNPTDVLGQHIDALEEVSL
ncbi:ATP-binding cassette domain-containing protein [Granulicoccus phenolivorans]|uniref:ATP-binding cassette domain-containing protein n=1 Tax=Granulicoccus phenolivorans TaxID=266854 RepID=UPI00040B4350|nr:ATP-binding cassette domain-containing protein [Granulicoccus phenolivorans]